MNKIISFILFVIFLALSLVSLLACIGLGVVGILFSSSGERDLSFYWMIGASAAVILLLLFCTLAVKFLVDFLIGPHEVEKTHNKDSTDATEMVNVPNDDGSDGNDDPNGKFVEVELYDYSIQYVRIDELNKLSFPAASLFFTSLVFFLLSLLGLMWMIFVAFDYQNQPEPVVWPFIVTECVIGLVCPIFLFIGGIFFGIVVGFVTAGQVDPKLTMTLVLPAVQLKEGELIKKSKTHEKKKFWVIADQFYMPIRDPCGKITDVRHAIDPSCSTWLLIILSGLAVILATSFFINQNVVEAITVPIQEIIDKSDICINYDCFAEETFDFVNCTAGSNLSNHNFLHCFRFYRLGVDVDLISTFGITVGFFLATVYFFRLVFVVTNVLLHIWQSKLWGILISICGVIIFVGALVVLFSSHFVAIHLDVIKVGQFFILSIYCFSIGILLCTSDIRGVVTAPIKRRCTLAKLKDLREGEDRQDMERSNGGV